MFWPGCVRSAVPVWVYPGASKENYLLVARAAGVASVHELLAFANHPLAQRSTRNGLGSHGLLNYIAEYNGIPKQ